MCDVLLFFMRGLARVLANVVTRGTKYLAASVAVPGDSSLPEQLKSHQPELKNQIHTEE